MGGGGSSSGTGIYGIEMPHNKQIDTLFDRALVQDMTTVPLRQAWVRNYFNPVLQGNYNVEQLPGYAPGYSSIRSNYENLYNQAKQNIIGSTPRGGAMAGALAQNEYQRAKNIGDATTGLTSNIVGDIMNKSYDYGLVKSPAQSMMGMGAAAGLTNQENIARSELDYKMQAANAQLNQQAKAANAQGKSSGLGLLGSGLGSILGMALAPMTGGTSLIGSAMSGLGGGKGGDFSGGGATASFGGFGPMA